MGDFSFRTVWVVVPLSSGWVRFDSVIGALQGVRRVHRASDEVVGSHLSRGTVMSSARKRSSFPSAYGLEKRSTFLSSKLRKGKVTTPV